MPCNEPDFTEVYKGHTIKIYLDQDARNPWKDEDGNPPIAIYDNDGIHTYGEENGDPKEAPTLTKKQIKKNLPALEMMLENSAVRFMGADSVNELISEHVDGLFDSERLEALETLFNLAGIPAYLKTVRGCSQGDWANVLAISTPAFEEEIGTKWTTKELEGSIQLYGDWAFGNVYGFVARDQDGKEIANCWGFYGDYDEEYGALSEAKSQIDYHVEQERKSHVTKIKAWIRNRVPLRYRRFAV